MSCTPIGDEVSLTYLGTSALKSHLESETHIQRLLEVLTSVFF